MEDKNKLQEEIKKQKKELMSKEKTILWQEKIINQLVNDRDRWHFRFNEAINEYNITVDNYNRVLQSPFWKISEPVRNVLDVVRGNKKEDLRELEEQTISEEEIYRQWIENNESSNYDIKEFDYKPLISIVVQIDSDNKNQIKECIDSVIGQTYTNWQLIITGNDLDHYKELIDDYINNDRILVIEGDINDGIAKTNGDFITFLGCKDALSNIALSEVVELLNNDDQVDYIYSDEDVISENSSIRKKPFFKPDWSPDTILWSNYTNHLSIYRKELVNKVGKLNNEFHDLKEYDFILRFIEKTTNNKIAHISKVLYHKREDDGVVSKNILKKIKEDVIQRRGLNAYVDDNDITGCYQIYYYPDDELVSIIIPSKDNFDVLKVCIDSITSNTKYSNYEIVVVDNGSNDENKKRIEEYLKSKNCTYYHDNYPFNFSYMCNYGASKANGEYLLFLNDDTEVIQEDWLDKMLGQAKLKHIGAVGVKLYYPNSTLIQHCGVANYSFGPSTYFTEMDDKENYYFYRNKANYNTVAVTGACLMINKEKYKEIGGFDEEFPNDYNDIDLCFKLIERGYYNICLNQVVLFHYESLSRGDALTDDYKMKKLIKYKKLLYDNHKKLFMYDPYYNVNLTQIDNKFGLDIY